MNSKNVKDLRKQLRNIVLEMLPEVLKSELYKEISKNLSAQITKELSKVHLDVSETLTRIDERSKDTLGYLARQSMLPYTPKPEAELNSNE